MPPAWTLRQADAADASWMAELRATVMRADLQRLGRWDPVRVRRRFLDGFHPAHTWVIELDTAPVGLIAVRPEADAQWVEHFYIYERHGFVHDYEGSVDVFLCTPAGQQASRAHPSCHDRSHADRADVLNQPVQAPC